MINQNEQENNKRRKLDVLAEFMEKHPELFYDTSELSDVDNNEVTQKTFEEWLDEFMENDEQDKSQK